MKTEHVVLRILRGWNGHQWWEEFQIELKPSMNLISALMEIQKNPVNTKGERTTPVAWEQGCLEEVCGSCSMLVNGYPRQACTALLQHIIEETKSFTIILAPFTKFPLIRDLVVDRTSMFESLKEIQAWTNVDGYYDAGFGPEVSEEKQEVAYKLSTCMTCGCCSESCPQVNDHSPFMGPAPISQARLFSIHPTARKNNEERIRALFKDSGIGSCGNAQNCVRVCPKKIPLTDSIAWAGRATSIQAVKDLFSLPERSS